MFAAEHHIDEITNEKSMESEIPIVESYIIERLSRFFPNQFTAAQLRKQMQSIPFATLFHWSGKFQSSCWFWSCKFLFKMPPALRRAIPLVFGFDFISGWLTYCQTVWCYQFWCFELWSTLLCCTRTNSANDRDADMLLCSSSESRKNVSSFGCVVARINKSNRNQVFGY